MVGQRKRSIGKNMDDNIKHLQMTFQNQSDLGMRYLRLKDHTRAVLIYLEALVDQDVLQKQILIPLLYKLDSPRQLFEESFPIPILHVTKSNDWAEVEQALLLGRVFFLLMIFNKRFCYNRAVRLNRFPPSLVRRSRFMGVSRVLMNPLPSIFRSCVSISPINS